MRARLIEQREREPRDLLRVLGPVVAALGELDDAAAPDVGIAIGLRDLLAVARDVVEDEPFAQRQVAERDLVGAEPPQDRRRAGSRRRPRGRRAAARARGRAAASRDRARTSSLRTRRICFAGMRRLRSGASADAASSAAAHRAEAQDRARRADDAVEAGLRDLIEVLADLGVDVAHQLALVARLERIGLDEPLGQADDAELEAAAQLAWSARCRA